MFDAGRSAAPTLDIPIATRSPPWPDAGLIASGREGVIGADHRARARGLLSQIAQQAGMVLAEQGMPLCSSSATAIQGTV
jgi:hypothetical protein